MKVEQDITAIIQSFFKAAKSEGGGNITINCVENINLGGNMQTQEGLANGKEPKKLTTETSLVLEEPEIVITEVEEKKHGIESVSAKKRLCSIPKIITDPEELKEKAFFSQEQKDNLYNLLSGFHGYSRLDALMYLLVTVCRERFILKDAAIWLWVNETRLQHYYRKFGFMKKKENPKNSSVKDKEKRLIAALKKVNKSKGVNND